jgi:enoyl-CoA hydratase
MGNAYPMFDSLQPGMKFSHQFQFSTEKVEAFSELVGDTAPIHFDETFAQKQGFEGCIVHGLLISSVFSGILGQQLPGPNSVINTISLKYPLPVLVGELINLTVEIKQLSEAVGVVVLSLSGLNEADQKVISGQANCSFPNRR